jgi:hypothetical protein
MKSIKDFFFKIFSWFKPVYLAYLLLLLLAAGGGVYLSYLSRTLHLFDRQPKAATNIIPDTTIVPAQGSFAYENKTNNFQTQFKKSPTAKESIVFSNHLGRISFYTPASQTFGELSSGGSPTTDGGTLTYSNIYPQIDLKYTISSTRLLEEFIVKDSLTASQITQIEQHATTSSTYTQNEDGSISFYEKNDLVFTLPHPVMYETGNPTNRSEGIVYEITPDKDQLIITKVITEEGQAWLSDPKRVYPIAIDLVIDNSDTFGNWVSSDPTNTVVSQETTIKQEGTGSVKTQTTAYVAPVNVDLMEYSSNGTIQSSFVTNSATANATGGTITTYGGNTIHTFISSGTFTSIPGVSSVKALVVAGGGGGGSTMGGGGGGGGVLYNSAYAVSPGTIAVSVGAGGAGGPAGSREVAGLNGQNSVFGTISAIGGGGGASNFDYDLHDAGNGGSGGGASGGAYIGGPDGYGGTQGSGTPGQGYNGAGSIGTWYPGGGGGGGGAGSSNPGNGGIGYLSSINGTSLYYGGGGGGAGYSNIAGNGGLGGGGGGAPKVSGGGLGGGSALNSGSDGAVGVLASATNVPGGNAGINTGGGGGGGSHYNTNNKGGNGGSGVVIISYVPPTNLQSYSEATIKTEGSYALKGVANITTSLNKTLTRTIASPLNLSGQNSVTFDIRASRTGSNIKVGLHDVGGITTEVTPNVTSANTFQSATIDLSAVTNANKDAIDQIIITIVNADAANTFYIDNMLTTAPTSLNDTVTRSTATTDLSIVANITYWVRSSVAGSYATFGFGENAATEQTNAITINSPDTWEQKSWNIEGITGTARDAVTKFAFTFTGDTSGAAFYFDDIQTNALFAPTATTPTALSTTSIRWNFTDNSTEETGFRIYNTSDTPVATGSAANLAYIDETGLTGPNVQYTRKIGTYNASFTPIPSGTVAGYTLAAVPAIPALSTRAATTININPDPGTNPAGTQMAIYKETGTTCDGSGGSYLAANGSDNGATAVWQTDAQWATVTATGLSGEQAYSFCVKARNGDNVETAFSEVGSYNAGFIPMGGDFICTQDTVSSNTITNRYVDGNTPGRYIIALDNNGTSTTNNAVFEAKSCVMTLNSTDTLVTGAVSLTGGSIAIADGAQIKLSQPVWVIDADADGYSADGKLYYGDQPAGGRRKNLITTLNTADCSDSTYATDNVCCTVATRYQDADGDTYGNPSVSISACTTAGYVDNNTDCNDASASLYRTVAGYLDSDADGYGAGAYTTCAGASGSYVANNTDCYDANANARPGSATCSTTNRGDGSYDYNCSSTSTACGTQYYSVGGTYIYYTCRTNGCVHRPDEPAPNTTCIGGASACGAAGYTAGNYGIYQNCESCTGYGPYGCTNLGSAGTQACQ